MLAALFRTHTDLWDHAQIEPFVRHREQLSRELGLTFDARDAAELDGVGVVRGRYDVVFLQDRSHDDDIVAHRVERAAALAPRIVFLDSFGGTYARNFSVLPKVDRYVRKAMLRDIRLYGKAYAGGRIFADHSIRTHRLEAPYLGRSCSDAKLLAKASVGWNIGVADHLCRQLDGSTVPDVRARHIDVFCRLGIPGDCEWLAAHRRGALAALDALRSEHVIVASGDRVPKNEYLLEQHRSKITVSPFGWAEVCLRDFEAVLAGSLLVKPSMEHVATDPDIYQDGVTYVSCKWDFSDLAQRCRALLGAEQERLRIVHNARVAYSEYFRRGRFVERIRSLIADDP